MSVQRASRERSVQAKGRGTLNARGGRPPPRHHKRADKAGSQRGGAVGGNVFSLQNRRDLGPNPCSAYSVPRDWRVHLPICRMGTIRPLSWAAVGTEAGDICKGCLRAWCAVGCCASPAALRSGPRSLRWRPLVAKV